MTRNRGVRSACFPKQLYSFLPVPDRGLQSIPLICRGHVNFVLDASAKSGGPILILRRSLQPALMILIWMIPASCLPTERAARNGLGVDGMCAIAGVFRPPLLDISIRGACAAAGMSLAWPAPIPGKSIRVVGIKRMTEGVKQNQLSEAMGRQLQCPLWISVRGRATAKAQAFAGFWR